VTTVALNATSDAPSNGRLPARPQPHLDLLTADGRTTTLPVTVTGAGHRGQHHRSLSWSPISRRRSARPSPRPASHSSALAVTNDVGTLIVTAVEPSIVKLTIHNGPGSRLSADQRRCAPATACSSSRDRGDLGTSCWKSDETGTALVQGRVAGADVAAQH